MKLAGRFRRGLFLLHGLVTVAAAVVLIVFPAAIPATVGIVLDPHDYLLSYFLAAAELAIGVLSIRAIGLTDATSVSLIANVFVIFHLATAALEIVYLARTSSSVVLVVNIVIRVIAAALFFIVGKSAASARNSGAASNSAPSENEISP